MTSVTSISLARCMREMATASETSAAARQVSPAWSDGGEYARAAEAAGVDVGSMLEAGVDAKQLLEFVSNYRKEEGEQYSGVALWFINTPRIT